MPKRFYWLKLKEDYFRMKEIKKLRSIAGGDTFTIIYLKMQLLSVKNNGILQFEGIEDDFVSELALELDESVENTSLTMSFLKKHNLIELHGFDKYFFPSVAALLGSEVDSAERVRRHRDKIKQELLPGNIDSLQSNIDVTKCNTDIDIELDKEIELDIKPKRTTSFIPPTIDEVKTYLSEKSIMCIDPESFVSYYEARGWMLGKVKVKNWHALIATWVKNNNRFNKNNTQTKAVAGSNTQEFIERLNNKKYTGPDLEIPKGL